MGTFVWLYSPRTNSLHLTMNSFVVLIQTPKGFRSIDLEGFSEDLNEDGFVDPVVPLSPHLLWPLHLLPLFTTVFPQFPLTSPKPPLLHLLLPPLLLPFSMELHPFSMELLPFSPMMPSFTTVLPPFTMELPPFSTVL